MPDDYGMARNIIEMFQQRITDLTGRLNAGDIDLLSWQIGMKDELRQLYSLQLIAAAKGNQETVSMDAWRTAESLLEKQYGYLKDFAKTIASGDLSDGQILARAALYARSGKEMFWTQSTSKADLPAMPGDGSSECLGNCGCEWLEVDGQWYWIRGKNDSCATCIQREKDWQPYKVA